MQPGESVKFQSAAAGADIIAETLCFLCVFFPAAVRAHRGSPDPRIIVDFYSPDQRLSTKIAMAPSTPPRRADAHSACESRAVPLPARGEGNSPALVGIGVACPGHICRLNGAAIRTLDQPPRTKRLGNRRCSNSGVESSRINSLMNFAVTGVLMMPFRKWPVAT